MRHLLVDRLAEGFVSLETKSFCRTSMTTISVWITCWVEILCYKFQLVYVSQALIRVLQRSVYVVAKKIKIPNSFCGLEFSSTKNSEVLIIFWPVCILGFSLNPCILITNVLGLNLSVDHYSERTN